MIYFSAYMRLHPDLNILFHFGCVSEVTCALSRRKNEIHIFYKRQKT